mmetsp:Transcript_89699/g.254335  ORF Transcript_89699/g.254335 Transcript_89699/m.254335 type:complete len:237 (-) Transcript_89699:1355-2065(-)
MYFWHIHWKPSLSVVWKISSNSRMTAIPRPRDLPEGFTIQALRPPLSVCCLFFSSSSFSTRRPCRKKFWPRGLSKLATGAESSSCSSTFGFFFFSFLPSFGLFFPSASFALSFASFASCFARCDSVGNDLLLIICSRSFSRGPPSKRCDTSSRLTCCSSAHSSAEMVQRPSASGGQSRTSSTSVTMRVQIFSATFTISWLKVAAAPDSMWRTNSRTMPCAFENLKSSTKSARSSGS